MLDSMGYLRGAVMKVGQTLANFPDIVPGAFVETLERLHCEAPPVMNQVRLDMRRSYPGLVPEMRP